jgi:hypothetical protein
MESQQPLPVEAIYDRILKRGSLQFLGYKRPFRVIASAMGALVRRGEATIHFAWENTRPGSARQQRFWRRAAQV